MEKADTTVVTFKFLQIQWSFVFLVYVCRESQDTLELQDQQDLEETPVSW